MCIPCVHHSIRFEKSFDEKGFYATMRAVAQDCNMQRTPA